LSSPISGRATQASGANFRRSDAVHEADPNAPRAGNSSRGALIRSSEAVTRGAHSSGPATGRWCDLSGLRAVA
jgi:hypothetical protein